MPPKAAKPKPNPFTRNRPAIRAPLPPVHKAAAEQAAAARAKAVAAAAARARTKKPACPNKECLTPDVIDGTCHSCGAIVDDSNIVSEVQFGESSSGAAVVQGSYVGADQGAANSMGSAFRRAGVTQDREGTNRSAKDQMLQLAAQLSINNNVVEAGHQIFKLASLNNFNQGRRVDMVAAVCLYSAARKEKPCRVMLIDFADKLSVNVFKLGHTYKALHATITISAEGIQPILPEDLIYRFAQKLEFGTATSKVAEDAVRMVKRMSLDWMVMGRRPSGVCGACLILAARMNNFRRTITEVVYVVKVTTHTIQKRLEEFKLTPSSSLTVEEFLNNEFLESAHDPPSFYEATEEFQKNKKRRKRKNHDGFEDDEEGSGSERNSAERSQAGTPVPEMALRRDADGFAIPNPPGTAYAQPSGIPIDPALTPSNQNTSPTPETQPASSKDAPPPAPPANRRTSTPIIDQVIKHRRTTPVETQEDADLIDLAMNEDGNGESMLQLVRRFGDTDALPTTQTSRSRSGSHDDDEDEDEEDEVIQEDENTTVVRLGKRKRGAPPRPRKPRKEVHVSLEWERDENILEQEIGELVSDPNTLKHALEYAEASKRVAAHMLHFESNKPNVNIPMDALIGEDEFKDDYEVTNCLLSPDESKHQEKIWVNANKRWLREQQAKAWQRRQAEMGPPKAKRNRVKKPRMGEGQKLPANSAGEAAVKALKERTLSKKINYEAVASIFEGIPGMGGGALGSAATSRMTSRAGSEFSDSETSSRASTPTVEELAKRQNLFIGGNGKGREKRNRGRTPREYGTTPLRKLAPSPAPSGQGSRESSVVSVTDLDYVPQSPVVSRPTTSSGPSANATTTTNTNRTKNPGVGVGEEGGDVDENMGDGGYDEDEGDMDVDDWGNGDVDVFADDNESFAVQDEDFGEDDGF